MRRQRITDLYAIPLVVGLVASALWWALTRDILFGLASLIGVLVISGLIWTTSPFLRRMQQIQSSELIRIYDSQSEAVKDIHMRLADASRLDILTVRGLGILGLNDSILRKPVLSTQDRRLNIRVLVLDPNSPAVATRAREVGESEDAFRHALTLGVERLRELADQNWHSVEVYGYTTTPCWRLITIDDTSFISFFGSAVEGHRSAMYQVDVSRGSSLGLGFRRMFEEMCASGRRIV